MLEIKNKLYTQRFFAESLPLSDIFKAVTYTQYLGAHEKIPFYYKKIYGETATLDLTKPLDVLFQDMKSNTRNEIRRAEKEGCVFEYNYDYDSFVPFYNDFCISKGLKELIYTSATLKKYDKTIITMAKYNGLVLAMHATVVNEQDQCALLLYSCSRRLNENVDRKMIGWGNRYLHWKEFELFKKMGCTRYEWNGVCTNPEKKEVYNISQFKLSFGGNAVPSLGLRSPLFVFLKSIQGVLNSRLSNR